MKKQRISTRKMAKCSSPTATADGDFLPAGAHQIEKDVQRALLAHPELQFSSLVIRRVRDGVCLEGVLEMDSAGLDVSEVVQRVSGVNEVLNHLVVRPLPPPKG